MKLIPGAVRIVSLYDSVYDTTTVAFSKSPVTIRHQVAGISTQDQVQ